MDRHTRRRTYLCRYARQSSVVRVCIHLWRRSDLDVFQMQVDFALHFVPFRIQRRELSLGKDIALARRGVGVCGEPCDRNRIIYHPVCDRIKKN